MARRDTVCDARSRPAIRADVLQRDLGAALRLFQPEDRDQGGAGKDAGYGAATARRGSSEVRALGASGNGWAARPFRSDAQVTGAREEEGRALPGGELQGKWEGREAYEFPVVEWEVKEARSELVTHLAEGGRVFLPSMDKAG